MNSITQFIEILKNNTESINFQNVITIIDENYDFTPTTFKNGNQLNNAGENNGSCKIFGFAKLQHLSKEETLLLFGDFYKDVLQTPEATDHQNIRNFMQFGWDGIQFEGTPLIPKSSI